MSATGDHGLVIAGDPVRGRQCGGCTACCTQVPVELAPGTVKKANQRCPMVRTSGCSIYARRPLPCRTWSCRWLFDPEAAELKRPDRSGVVIDCVPDEYLHDGVPQYAMQIWVDPRRPEAHRDPALRRYLAIFAERHSMPTLVRWSSYDAMMLIAPSLNDTGEWVELQHATLSADDMKRRLAEAKAQAALAPEDPRSMSSAA